LYEIPTNEKNTKERIKMYKLKQKFTNLTKEKISPILLLLATVQIVALLISNIVAAKTFPLFTLSKWDLTIVMPCAVFLFPITYIVSDIISEVYKYKWSRRVCWTSFTMNLLMVLCFEIAIKMPGETDLSVLGSTWFLLLSSLLSYTLGGWVNDITFRKMKKKSQGKHLTGRILISSVLGQFTDSLLYIPLAMYVFPKLVLGFSFMTIPQVVLCVLLQPCIKLVIELIVSPFTRHICLKLNKVEAEVGNRYGEDDENFDA
jgi:uncharacterized integral membrane protein (TIGR00697 family)